MVHKMDFLILGNHPFLDFVNTRPVVQGNPCELLADGSDLLNLLGRLALPKTPELRKSVDDEVNRAAREAREMREEFRALLYRLFEPEVTSLREAELELEAVNRWIAKLGSPRLNIEDELLALSFSARGYIAPLLYSAMDLFASPLYKHIRKCSNPECVLWYVDTTKSHTRRWCSMSMCGNAHKAREFRKRHQEK